MAKNLKQKLILVNTITGIRAIGSFAIIPIYLLFGPFVTGLWAILFFSTDWIDGLLARKLKCATFFGAIFDGLVDKAFAIITLAILISRIPWIFFILIFEICIFAVGYNALLKGNHVASSKIGKFKMIILSLAIIGCFFMLDLNHFCLFVTNFIHITNCFNINNNEIIKCLIVISIIFEIITLINYIISDLKIEQNKQQKTIIVTKKIYQTEKSKMIAPVEIKKYLFDPDYYQKHKNDNIKDLILRKDENE